MKYNMLQEHVLKAHCSRSIYLCYLLLDCCAGKHAPGTSCIQIHLQMYMLLEIFMLLEHMLLEHKNLGQKSHRNRQGKKSGKDFFPCQHYPLLL